MPGMNDRDHFAAAALTGLLYPEVDDEFAMPYIVGRAYLWADAMLRERCRGGGDCPGSDNAPNLDAAPAARAAPESVGTDKAEPLQGLGTGDTQEPVAWGVASHFRVLATSISRMDAVDMQSDYAYHTEIVPLYRSPPVTKPMPKEKRAEVSDRSKPITGPDPDSRVWETHTPATHATRGEGSEQRECTEPVAWAVCTPGDGDWSPCFFHEPHAQRCASAIFGSKNIVPLYRSPTLTDAEREAVRTAADAYAVRGSADGRESVNAATLRGLLERLGGEK